MKNRFNLPHAIGLAVGTLLLAAGAAAQELQILQVQLESSVDYVFDVTDPSKIGRNPGPVAPLTAAELRNYWRTVGLADIIAVNGSAAMGVAINELQTLLLRPASMPGQAIADVTRGSTVRNTYEFLRPDGTYIGAIFAAGFTGGGTNAILGGTGAFLGVRGDLIRQGAPRQASQAEDPSMRRINGGTRPVHVFRIVPMFRPEVVIGPNGPVVFHSDGSPVTAASPARAGEILIVYAKGLGPTTPSVNPGEAFPSEPLAVATSPVEVLVNAKSGPAINQVGVPGTTDTYRVDFRLPDDTAAGSVSVQISAAWIKGSAVSIPTR